MAAVFAPINALPVVANSTDPLAPDMPIPVVVINDTSVPLQPVGTQPIRVVTGAYAPVQPIPIKYVAGTPISGVAPIAVVVTGTVP